MRLHRATVIRLEAAGILAMAACGFAQAPSATPQRFDVVSIRPTPTEGNNFRIEVPQGTHVSEVGISLWDLIKMSFGVEQNQMSAPEWTKSEKFSIEAKTGDATALTYDQMKPLMQQMLAERFGLAYHRETRNVAGYALVVAKGGPKLQPSKENASGGGNILRDGVEVKKITMNGLAHVLAYPLGQQPVVDRTGINGFYEVKLRFAPQDAPDSPLPSIFTALQEQLGLKLESAKVPVEILVVDYVLKTATEN